MFKFLKKIFKKKNVTITAKITRANGGTEDLGVIAKGKMEINSKAN